MTLIDLPFATSLLNAAGTLGFSPDARRADLDGLGGFVTNPISYAPHTTAAGVRIVRYTGGLLLHTGYPNPGFYQVVKQYRQRWARSELPIVAHLLAEDADEMYRMVRVLEDLEGVLALEIGLPPGPPADFARSVVQAAVGELPVIARVGLEDMPILFQEMIDAGASALSMGPPRGSLPGSNNQLVSGRLVGAAIFPQALEMLRLIHPSAIDIIFSGGVQNKRQVALALQAGASAVQLDLSIWRFGSVSLS